MYNDPKFSPAMNAAIDKFLDMMDLCEPVVISSLYRESVAEGIDKSAKDDVRKMLSERLEHIDEMIKVNGHSECYKEFKNVVMAMIDSHDKSTEKVLAHWMDCVTKGIAAISKRGVSIN